MLGGDPNVYAYVHGNVLRATDLVGLTDAAYFGGALWGAAKWVAGAAITPLVVPLITPVVIVSAGVKAYNGDTRGALQTLGIPTSTDELIEAIPGGKIVLAANEPDDAKAGELAAQGGLDLGVVVAGAASKVAARARVGGPKPVPPISGPKGATPPALDKPPLPPPPKPPTPPPPSPPSLATPSTPPGVSNAAPLQPGKTPLRQFDIDAYGNFNTRARAGDGLDGHELLQNAWLKANGYVESRGAGPSRQNPAVALSPELHAKIGVEQKALGLNDPATLRGMSMDENIRLNKVAMERAGVPEPTINQLEKQAVSFGKELKK